LLFTGNKNVSLSTSFTFSLEHETYSLIGMYMHRNHVCYAPLHHCYIFYYVCLFDGVSGHFQHYFSHIAVGSFIDGGNWSTQRKPPTCRKSLTNFITQCCMTTPRHEQDSNSLIALMVIYTDYIGSCKSNNDMIMTVTALSIKHKMKL